MPRPDRAGRFPLHYQALEGDTSAIQAAAGVADADVDVADAMGMTPLHFAAQGLHLDAVDALLNAGASVDAQDHLGRTPLMVALLSLHDETREPVVWRLLEGGADPDVANSRGRSPRGYAAIVANRDFRKFFADK